MKSILAVALLMAAASASAESLYVEQAYRPLVSDNKAHRVGDALTVLVMENAGAASSADNTGDRKQGVGVDYVDSLHMNRSFRVQTNNDFDGRGATQRSGRLLAQIGVTVVGMDPNGDLLIKGEQLIEINREQQKIRLEGRVRPQDVDGANTISSTRIADAHISYVGDGDVSKRARPSWWHDFLTWIGL